MDDYSQGDVVCRSCGLVVESGIVERKPFVPATTRVNAPATKRPPDCRKKNSECHMKLLCETAGIPSIAPIAREIWDLARERPGYKARKGDNVLGYMAAVVFHACKVSGVPRTPKELCRLFGAKLSAMRRMVKETQGAADSVANAKAYSFSAPDPVSIIHRYLYKLDLSKENQSLLKECARDLWKKYGTRLDTYERDSIIAGMIYYMYGVNRDYIDEIAEACCVCKNTVKGVSAKISEWERV